MLARGEQALVLIPEIALTPQTLERFAHRFGGRRGLSLRPDRTRAGADVDAVSRRSDARVLIGTRSAIFVPFAALGLIVVDEEHDGSFKQQDGFRYSARDLATKRAQLLGMPLLMGTATPALETLHNAQRGRYRHVRLTARPGAAQADPIRLVDIRGLKLEDGHERRRCATRSRRTWRTATRRCYSSIAAAIRRRICARAAAGAPDVRAARAGLTLHQSPAGFALPPLRLRIAVAGALSGLRRHAAFARHRRRHTAQRTRRRRVRFPNVPVIRIDRDTTRSARTMASHLESIGRGEPAVLVGTQMLAKGHHFPRVTLVGV